VFESEVNKALTCYIWYMKLQLLTSKLWCEGWQNISGRTTKNCNYWSWEEKNIRP
jgi:hypothetical protein